jgi:hypothetical protein
LCQTPILLRDPAGDTPTSTEQKSAIKRKLG